jgi:hypothetical protein
MAKARRTTHRSTAGKKLYAVRDADGKFKDIQTYERAHRADLAKTSKAEAAKGKKKVAKKVAKKKVAKKPVKKAAKKR